MTIKASASFNNRVNYSVADTYGNISQTDSDSQTITSSYTHGTGDFQINTAVSISGTLGSGEFKSLDLYNSTTGILKVNLGITGGVPMDNVKHISIYNISKTEGVNMEISNTGTFGLAGFIGDAASQTGVTAIRPYSSFTYNNPYGSRHDAFANIENESKFIFLKDAGLGASYKALIMGVDYSQPTGVTPSNPYS